MQFEYKLPEMWIRKELESEPLRVELWHHVGIHQILEFTLLHAKLAANVIIFSDTWGNSGFCLWAHKLPTSWSLNSGPMLQKYIFSGSSNTMGDNMLLQVEIVQKKFVNSRGYPFLGSHVRMSISIKIITGNPRSPWFTLVIESFLFTFSIYDLGLLGRWTQYLTTMLIALLAIKPLGEYVRHGPRALLMVGEGTHNLEIWSWVGRAWTPHCAAWLAQMLHPPLNKSCIRVLCHF